MIQKSTRKNELQDKLIDILYESKAISLEMNREDFNPKVSLIKDLKLDSIQLLEYLMAIELKLDVNVDYEDLQIDVFDDFNEFTNYFYQKVTG
jgi:acyl carrier protein